MEEKPALLVSLAASIYTCAQCITAYCEEVQHPQVSLEPEAPTTLLPSTAPQQLLTAQQTLLESLVQLQHLAFDVADFLPRQQVYYQQLSALQWLCHFNILPHIPLSSPITYTSLASISSVSEPLLRRIAPMAISASFLRSPSPEHLSHTRLSFAFASDPSLQDWLRFLARSSAPTALKLVEATERRGEGIKPSGTAYSIAMGTEMGFFEHLKAEPERGRDFARYMASLGRSKGMSLEYLVRGFDWEGLGEGALVVDVGGSIGNTAHALASAFSNIQVIVQDLPDTISTAEARLNSLSPNHQRRGADRIFFQAHDFFTPQPVRGADVYLLRAILHDWPDAKAVEILGHLVEAATAGEGRGVAGEKGKEVGSRIVIMDSVMPPSGRVGAIEEAALRVRDMTMLEVFNSKERDEGDWRALLGRVGTGVKKVVALRRTVQSPGSMMAIMEVGV